MEQRFVSIWFPYLITDWFSIVQKKRENISNDGPVVVRSAIRGRMVVTATNAVANALGIATGMTLADARALLPELVVYDDPPGLPEKLLRRLAEWCIRFTPIASVDSPDGLLLDVSGCTHLWGGDEKYLDTLVLKLKARGYAVKAAMADVPGVAWGMARTGNETISPRGQHVQSLLPLPTEALRLEPADRERLYKLGIRTVEQLVQLPFPSLRRRFGSTLLMRLHQALGHEAEPLQPVIPMEPYRVSLPCLEPIVTATGIEIAVKELLTSLCLRLKHEQKGIRLAVCKAYRVDDVVQQIRIATNRASHHVAHLFKLFELTLSSFEPDLGFEAFTLEATVEDCLPQQGVMWGGSGGLEDERLSEFLDRVSTRIGPHVVQRYLPTEHYWPERSCRLTTVLNEPAKTTWRPEKMRPLLLLPVPEPIEVTAPIPDYPPMLFRHKGAVHKVLRADGPERIEQEWWLQTGQHRDYYRVEDEAGKRYWIFRLGHYHEKAYRWFLHGFFE